MRHRGLVERGVLIAVAGLRWAAWVWLAAVALANLDRIHHPMLAVAAVIVTAVVTAAAHLALRGDQWRRALRPTLIGAEVAVAAAVVLADGWIRQGRITGQTLAGTWPLPAILVSAVAGGLVWGVVVGALLSIDRGVAVLLAGAPAGQAGRSAVAALSTGVSWIVIGAVCGIMITLLRRTQTQLAEAEVRERMARDLHDGVLQTLALIERRSPSPDIARLAREQERDLRAYLFGDRAHPGGLAVELRRVAARFEQDWPDTKVTVSVSDDAPTPRGEGLAAVCGAVAEALTNAAKHGNARHAVVFGDLDEASGGLFVAIKDDGSGFETAAVDEGIGMGRSIRGRVEGIGGNVEFASAIGDGTEVRLILPAGDKRRTRAHD